MSFPPSQAAGAPAEPAAFVERVCRALGAEGELARELEGFSVRTGQIDVARAVGHTLSHDRILICEAGTGIGKTFAYLVPALLSGRRVVISTATKALQEQIAYRDLPVVQRALGTRVPVSVMKGLSNYLCRRRFKEFFLSPEALRPAVARDLELVSRWSKSTETGDLAELVTLSESAPIRGRVASSSETRIGSRCPYYDECFVTQMKRDAEQSQIIVTNHHLFFADLALRGPHPGRVIPDYDAVVLDEAHQIEDVAALFFGVRVTQTQIERLARDASRLMSRTDKKEQALEAPTARWVGETSRAWFAQVVPRGAGRLSVRPDQWSPQVRQAFASLDGALADLAAACSTRAGGERDDVALQEGLELAARRAENIREGLREIVEGRSGRVTWADRKDEQVSLSSTPVDMSNILADRLFESVPAVSLLSATLSTSARPGKSGFSYVRARLGVGEERVDDLRIASPFDYENRCLLYLPGDLGEPRHPSFLQTCATRAAELVELTDGGAFVLTTSLASMNALYGLLREKLPEREIWVQGQRPKAALLSAFRGHGRALLVATTSFWEGVDVPGDALRLVVLEKLPFAVPSDPVVQARGAALEAQGKSAFAHLALPQAAISLKQGFGRLIRTTQDWGIVAIFDARATNKPYGKRLLDALPPARRTDSWSEVEQFVHRFAQPASQGARADVVDG